MVQNEIIANFNKDMRPHFNPAFFMRSEMDIVEELKKVILSSQRSRFFTIEVKEFNTITNYAEVRKRLYEYEELYSKNRRSKENVYSYINLRDSDVILLEVKYHIAIKDQEDTSTVLIEVPRIVDKYYFKIAGNMYSALYQIVDASTYNNAASTSKKHMVILKTMFMPVKIYRDRDKKLTSYGREKLKCTFYETRAFNKTVPVMKYFFARFGFYGAIHFFGLDYISVSKEPVEFYDTNYYSFMKNDIAINCPKMIFEQSDVAQSFVYTIMKAILKDTTVDDIYTTDFWAKSVGMEFSNSSPDKGYAVLDSLEKVYDMTTQRVLHLPEDQKADIYCVLRWMVSEFANLRKKDNIDISTKRIRFAEYLASLYAMKLSQGIYRVSDMANRAEIKSIKRAIEINPAYLLTAITKCRLVTYRNIVNDLDAIGVMKYSYKGISGIGEKGSSAVPQSFKHVNISHLGRVDLDSSSASDPGMSGALCPLQELHGDSVSFSEFEEPNTWEEELKKTLSNFRSMVGKKEVFSALDSLLGEDHKEEIQKVDEDIKVARSLINPFIHLDVGDDYGGYPLEGSGLIQYMGEV